MFSKLKKQVVSSEIGIIIIGACIIVTLSLSSYFITRNAHKKGFDSFQAVIQQNLKAQYLLLTMSNSIRDRIINVHDLNLSNDPFVIDEFNLELQQNAIDFVTARDQLIQLGLPKNQLNQLNKLKNTLKSLRSKLDQVVEAKTNNNDVVYQGILIKAHVANDSILHEIKALINIQLSNAQLNLLHVKRSNSETQALLNLINSVALILSLMVTVFIIMLLKRRRKQLNKVLQDLEDHNKNLESTVSHRTNELLLLQKEHSRVNAEMEVNQQLQKFISPTHQELKQFEHLDIATYIESAEEVGGDYVDVLPYQDGQLICIGDVTDHGLKSSIIMLMTQSIIRHQSNDRDKKPLTQALNDINVSLFQNIQRMKSDRHLSLSLLHLKDNKLIITGQHEVIIIVRKAGAVEQIDTDELGFYVGFIDDIEPYTQTVEVPIEPGDLVLLHTDGITEAANTNEALYGFNRLVELTKKHHNLSAYDIIHHIISDLNHFVGSKALYDDLALIAFKIV